MNLKERITGLLGGTGIFVYYLITIIISVLPLVMLGLPFWANLIIVLVVNFAPTLFAPILWIAGLIGAICGTQDWMAYVYYALFAILAISFLLSLLKK